MSPGKLSDESTAAEPDRAVLSAMIPAAAGAETVLDVEDLHTYFATPSGTVKAVDGVSLKINRDDVLGLVGETGSGKSMTAASIMGLIEPPGRIVRGRVLYRGRDLVELSPDALNELRGKKISLVPQNARAALNPLLPVGKQMSNVWAAHLSLKGRQATAYSLEMLAAVGFDDPSRVVRSYPHQLSGGMAQRVVIAMAIGPSPDLVIADEPTTGLDATIQLEILNLMLRMLKRVSASALLITHDLGVVAHYCSRVAVMHAGHVVEEADVESFFARPLHPYSAALVDSLRSSSRRHQALYSGDPPDLTNLPSGCRYRWRCPLAVVRCETEPPELRLVENGHMARCHRAEDVGEARQ